MLTTRRQFLIGGVRVAAAVPLVSLAGGQRAASRGDGERVLVVLQLTGGNDALNMVVPHRQDDYYRMRPALSLARGSLHELDDDHGLHAEMGGLGELFAEGDVAVVHGVGYPESSRSHFRSMEIWHTADPDAPPGDTGWMGRLADQIALGEPGTMAALHVGGGDLPLALFGRDYFSPTVRDARGFRLHGPADGFEELRARLLERPSATGELAFLREAALCTYRAAERMAKVAERGSSVSYPDLELARRMRLIARLISGDFGTRVFHVALDGFDTHARQKATHAALLGELSRSLTAFQRDLEASGAAERVVTLVFSEFGRRVNENASKGTDHGAGAPVLVVGRAVRGGLHGTPPDLGRLENGDVPPTTDFRSVYAALERDWMGLRPSSDARALDLLDA